MREGQSFDKFGAVYDPVYIHLGPAKTSILPPCSLTSGSPCRATVTGPRPIAFVHAGPRANTSTSFFSSIRPRCQRAAAKDGVVVLGEIQSPNLFP